MSFVNVAPELLETAASDAAHIGATVRAGNMAALIPTTELATAGADEVSAAIAAVFGTHAQQYQAAAAQAATYYEQFVQNLSAAAGAYTAAEASIATGLQSFASDPLRAVGEAWVGSPLGRVLDPLINAPTDVLLGRDLIGDGAIGTAPRATQIVIDFVRHGQSFGNALGFIDTAVPGTGLTALGEQQAQAIAAALGAQGPFAGIFSSQLLRAQETAAPLAGMLTVPALPGLNEIDAGIFSSFPEIPAGLLYIPAPLAWTLGFPLVPMLTPGSVQFNGVVFDQGFTNALQTMYSTAMANPVVAQTGHITDVAFSSEFAIEVGTLMNVKNPDLLLMLTHPLSNTGVVVVQGDPQDGWNLVSWDGVPVAPASLPTQLFVDVRDLVMAPQFAAYSSWQSLFTGDPTAIASSIRNGVDGVGNAALNFPGAVTRDLIGALGAGPSVSAHPIIDVAVL
ncbi:PE domain-containing protein [Mycobacterium sp. 050134]|uniref:PE domain-containing protein n=1 Tax=Mycobacterium sp. 050134 TaxID=3096111 RepID=UPI002ED91ADF